jgi:NAD(P)-dependent dehydrogenase (short-subunit alcohol dehydrogenase family)
MEVEISTTESRRALAPRPPRFAGKVALVTGASDKGIGGAVARRLAEEGAAISLVSRHEPGNLLRRLRKTYDANYVFTTADIRDSSEVNRVIDATMEEYGQIDVLINNAGVDVFGSFESCTDEAWNEILDVNLTGAMRFSRAALPFLPQPGGVIVNVASALGLGGCKGFAA